MSGERSSERVVVVIPALDAEDTLDQQLGALHEQRGIDSFDVVVSDNGSRDGTRRVVESWAARGLPVRVVDASDVVGPAYARNAAVDAAPDAELIVFCDADDVVAPDWLRGLVAELEHSPIVSGRVDASALNQGAVARWRAPREKTGLAVHDAFLPFAPSNNLGVRRSVWNELEGMNVDYRQAEDVEFSWRAQLAGHRIGFVPDAVVHYRYRVTPRSIYDQAVRSGRASAQLHRQFREHGHAGRPVRTTLSDWLWLVARAPMLAEPDERGVWLRRFGQAVGRLRGSIEFAVRYL